MGDTQHAPKRRRGRPREFDRERALDRALAVFWAQGYEGTSLRDLTTAMGISPPSLYAAFGSKEQLYREVLERYRARSGDVLQRALEEGASPFAALLEMLREFARDYTAADHPRGCMISTGMLACAAEHAEVAEWVGELRSQAHASLREFLQQSMELGDLPADTDVESLARYYACVIQGMSVQARDGASREELVAVVDVAMRAWPGAVE